MVFKPHKFDENIQSDSSDILLMLSLLIWSKVITLRDFFVLQMID
jgi:hypothetical protein